MPSWVYRQRLSVFMCSWIWIWRPWLWWRWAILCNLFPISKMINLFFLLPFFTMNNCWKHWVLQSLLSAFLFYFFIVAIIIIIILSNFHLDIDECINKKHSCEGNTTCNNTIGSYICRRKEGYQEIETNCTGKYSYLTTGNVNISVKTTTLA